MPNIGPLEILIGLAAIVVLLAIIQLVLSAVRGDRRPQAATKICPSCGASVFAAAQFCPRCGYHAAS